MADTDTATETTDVTCVEPPPTDVQSTSSEWSLYVVGTQLKDDDELMGVLKYYDTQMLFIDGQSDIENILAEEKNLTNSCFVISHFEGDTFHALHKVTSQIFGPVAVKQLLSRHSRLPTISRPLFCTAMSKVVVCFTGFRQKENLNTLVELVHHMGGSVRKDFSPSVTHLVANSTSGPKYRYAVCLGKPRMNQEWILQCWEKKDYLDFVSADVDETLYRVKPFLSCSLTFVGFSSEEKLHMEELTVSNGGKVCQPDDTSLTHMIIDDQSLEDIPLTSSNVFLVKVEWFWVSIQIDARADELIYQPKSTGENGSTRETPTSGLTPNSRARKRKRLKDTVGQLASLSDLDVCSPLLGNMKQRRSGEHNDSASLLDATVSPIKGPEEKVEGDLLSDGTCLVSPINSAIKPPLDLKSMSPRQQVCHELLQTEINYVGILQTIIILIRDPIEDPDQVGGPLLDPTEVKIIFGNVPPIFDIHRQLRDDIMEMMNSWKEDNSIGEIILRYSQDFLKAYPPFVNFFEKTKEMVIKCDNSKPRFHAFLKLCQKNPECGRQSLVELLIRPVQRLPSVILLLNDILKHTAKNNPDCEALEKAIGCLKEVLTHINEDKRKTESQVAMFGIVNDIENCPPNLLSSHRTFVTKADMIELANGLSGKGDHLTMFLFTDVLEICKRRKNNGGLTSQSSTTSLVPLVTRSPSVASLHSIKNNQKKYKHLELMPLSHIKRIVDILETDECHNVFALVCRSPHELKERLYTFTLVNMETESQGTHDTSKVSLLQSICRNVANTVCRRDMETLFTSLEPHHLDIMSSDTTMNTLSKAVRFASRTSKKVGRAFSFSKTPRRLSRAMSTMFSPLKAPVSPSMSPLKLASRKFSCVSTSDLHLIDPSTTQSSNGRKLKSHTIGPSSVTKMS